MKLSVGVGVLVLLLVPLLYALMVGFPATSEARVTCPDGRTVQIPLGQKVEGICASR